MRRRQITARGGIARRIQPPFTPPFFFFFFFFFYFFFFRPRRILRAWHDGVGAAAWHGQRKT